MSEYHCDCDLDYHCPDCAPEPTPTGNTEVTPQQIRDRTEQLFHTPISMSLIEWGKVGNDLLGAATRIEMLERELAAAKDVKPIAGKFLPDEPTHFDCLHAIRAIIGRSSLMPSSGDDTIFAQLYNLADAGLHLNPDAQASRLAAALEDLLADCECRRPDAIVRAQSELTLWRGKGVE